ncbi:TatA/E family twin arginine-targeting protein translocase [Synechococcus sp. PCC 6312]|uniref:TatA/E family twin arginine-targeting protein translocase n=1 Tax=Synechococcus sp. (strain ATCC 27167 / PCC 6312) TaxID=195253 RepID=UPI00029EDCF0|nr:TatA/E family twin arginine-targeting protein translocase [Synechococcus sp. PCC 6312]AFY61020.1 twin arginine-targeting protein translocase, TatA/E family [Synechococcus sp. PCC 6312]
MNFFGIGLPEIILILVVALLVFGPKKLPEIGKSLGKALRSFQDASRDFQDEFKRQAAALESEPTPTVSLPPAQAPELSPVESVVESAEVSAVVEAVANPEKSPESLESAV